MLTSGTFVVVLNPELVVGVELLLARWSVLALWLSRRQKGPGLAGLEDLWFRVWGLGFRV